MIKTIPLKILKNLEIKNLDVEWIKIKTSDGNGELYIYPGHENIVVNAGESVVFKIAKQNEQAQQTGTQESIFVLENNTAVLIC